MVIIMNIDIRQSVIDKIKGDNEEDLIKTINESVTSNDELVLPGLGVMLELFWNNLNEEVKHNIAGIIKSKIV